MATEDLSLKRRIAGRHGAHIAIVRYGADAIAARARAGLVRRWLAEAAAIDPDGQLTEAEICALADELRAAHFRQLQVASVRARCRNRQLLGAR